jgi:hypothetical protein
MYQAYAQIINNAVAAVDYVIDVLWCDEEFEPIWMSPSDFEHEGAKIDKWADRMMDVIIDD